MHHVAKGAMPGEWLMQQIGDGLIEEMVSFQVAI